jgi:imidazolonepropionase-like amidohydrolase
MRILSFGALTVLALLVTPASHAAEPPQAEAGELRYVYLTQGNPAGKGTTRPAENGGKGAHVFTYEYNDRGRGPRVEERVRTDERGIPVEMRITGNDYWKVAVDERFDLAGGKATWKSGSEAGEKALQRPASYLSLNGAPQEVALLIAAVLQAGGTLDLLPSGTARVEKVRSVEVKAGGKAQTVDLYSLQGLGFTPGLLWLDAQHHLFASIQSGWSTFVREGWESATPELEKVEQEINAARESGLAKRLARRPQGGLAVVHARLFDPVRRVLVPGTTVLVAGNRIEAVGPDGEVKIPAGLETIDARGKVLLPGMWDMHAHVGEIDGLLNLAAGITTVRDLANDTDKLLALRKRWDAGEAIGTRVLMAGFMDGPGPFAGPTKVLIDTVEEGVAAVENYAKLGYVQIKLYSSLDPKLVPPIVKRAHELGLRVSGHIPNGMSAEEAVRAGFDEVQHVNFLYLNFLPKTIDTRTPARFIEVAENAAGFDLKSEKAEAFFALLKERGTVSDPTLATFEDLFSGRLGELSRTYGVINDRLPAQVQRGAYGGGLNPPAEKVQRYRDSYRQCLAMVKALYDHGIRIVPGTDALAGFAYHRELELYVEAGIPAPEVLRIATLGAAEVMKRDGDLGSVAPGKLADFILVDGDPITRISDIRRVVLTVKDGTIFDPAKLYEAVGVKPAV